MTTAPVPLFLPIITVDAHGHDCRAMYDVATHAVDWSTAQPYTPPIWSWLERGEPTPRRFNKPLAERRLEIKAIIEQHSGPLTPSALANEIGLSIRRVQSILRDCESIISADAKLARRRRCHCEQQAKRRAAKKASNT